MAVLDIKTFKLVDGADEKAFLDADGRVQTEFVPNLPGFVRRTTARGSNGYWAVVTIWSSIAPAEAAAELAKDDAVTQMFASFVDQSTVYKDRFTTLD
jgi:hypothetical protein